jgi:hypothetical protein
MPCPVCQKPIGHDHRLCLFEMLKEGTIQTVEEWERLSSDRPKTIRKGRVRAVLPKE